MTRKIARIIVRDIRFPTSLHLDGSDAMNPAPDYSAAYATLETDDPGAPIGHGMTFTIGRGNELCVAGIRSLAPLLTGMSLEDAFLDMGAVWRRLTGDSQLRWVGPDKGVIHLATAALMNALWDLYAKMERKPLWRLLSDMAPAEIVKLVDWRFLKDALTPEEATAILEKRQENKRTRIEQMLRDGYPAYTTSPGWLGYTDEKMRYLCREAIAQGFTHVKMKVGANIEQDLRRAAILREELGAQRFLMMDANQVWGVQEAIDNMRQLARYAPWWIEEPTHPDDILGHATIARALQPLGIGVATGEHCHNAIMFKQLLQARAIQFCQLDSCRLASLNEIVGVLLMAEKFGVPVCPHAGGVGLCEYVQHIALLDYTSVSASLDNRVLEYVDHLHEHFVDPVIIRRARYVAPSAPGYSITMKPQSLADYEYPSGAVWRR
jgi:L-fuconate dehydratase